MRRDTNGNDDDASFTVTVVDRPEPPGAPTVTGVSASGKRLSLTWTAPANAGRPAIEGYNVQYRQGTSGRWSDGPQGVTGTSAGIEGLAPDTEYQVQVQATNAEGAGPWSSPPSNGRTARARHGICERSSAVREALMEVALRHLISPPHRGTCDEVTEEMLAMVPDLVVDEMRFGALSSLSPGDFAGLSGVRELWIYGHKGLTELPAGVFQALESLEELRIWSGLPPDSSGGLTKVSPGAFRGLSKLRLLDLRGNDLTSLEPGTFDGLVALETLDVQDNALTSLPLDELEALPRLGRGGRWSGILGARGMTPGMQLSRTTVTVAAGGSTTYRVRLLTPPDYIVGPSGGKRLVHGVVRVSAPTGVTVDNDGLTFTDQDWFRRQTVTVSVDAGATSGVKELAHTVDGPYLRVGVRDSATPYPVVLSVTVTGRGAGAGGGACGDGGAVG